MDKAIKKKEPTTSPIRIDKKVLASVKKHIQGTGMTISGFVNSTLSKAIKVK